MSADPWLTLEFVDPEGGARGYLVIDRLVRGLAAGGLRIQPGLHLSEVRDLARHMTRKQRAVALEVGGAKAGLDLDPTSPAKGAVLARFLQALKPIIMTYWSCGPDMNTTMRELEVAGRALGIPSLKIAVARSRGIPDEVFLKRYALLEEDVGGFTVNQLRGGAAAHAATLVILEELAQRPGQARVALQGAGNVGGAVACLLEASGVPIVAWADDRKCLHDERGLPVSALLSQRSGGRLPEGPIATGPPLRVLETPCDVLVLAAGEATLTVEDVTRLRCRTIVEAANLAFDEATGDALHRAGILVIPGLLASAGGSLAIEALYATEPTSGREVLRHVGERIGPLVRRLVAERARTGRSAGSVVQGWTGE